MNPTVKYTGSFFDASGYGSANRAFITALYVAGVDLTTELAVHMKERTEFGWEGELCYRLRDRKIPYKIKIIHLTPDMYDKYLEKDIYTIGHLFWETDRLPKDWDKYCNKMGEIWTSSPHMVKLLKESGVKVPIFAFPQPIDITQADKDYGKYTLPSHKGLLFYSMFQWIERKNPRALLQAYWEAFNGNENVSLLLKTFRLSYDEQETEKIRQDIRDWKIASGVKNPPRVYLYPQLMSQEEIMRLHNTGDAFVLPHRGEGWNRCIHESLLMGKPVIATARGGIHEYLSEQHYFPVESKYIPVTEVPWIKFYTKDQMWAEADHDNLIKNMRFVYDNFELAQAKGITAKEFMKDGFSYHRVGQLMKQRLETIYKAL